MIFFEKKPSLDRFAIARELRSSFVLTIVLLAALLLTGCSLVSKRETTGPELIENSRVKADVWTVKKGTLSVELTGSAIVVPARTDFQSFKVNGTLGEARVKRGDRVSKGDVLFRLRTDDFDLLRARQKLAVETMQAALRRSLESGHADDIAIDRMNLEIEQLKLTRLLDSQSKSELVSTGDGIVTFIDDIRIGSKVEAYRSVVGIAQTDALLLQYVGDLSAYIGDIKLGMPVALQYEGVSVKAKVADTPLTIPQDDFPQRAGINAKKLIFEFVDPIPAGLALGANLNFTIELVRKPEVLMIPRGALRHNNGTDIVQIVDGGIHRDVDVQVGLVTRTEVEIVSGLAVGQFVVIRP